MVSFIFSLLSIFSLLPLTILAQNASAASTLYLSETETTFSLNIANDSSDIFIYFSSPAFSWVAVGAGDQMKGSLMFVMYPSADNKNVTISPRIATGNTEPTFAPEIQFEALPGTGISNDSFVLNAVCHNCRSWKGGSLDLASSSQPWMYAFGPDNQLQSDKQDAGLRRHRYYGHFTMDMQFATGKGGVPQNSTTMTGASLIGDKVKDGDRAALAHAVLFCVTIFILWPLNVILAGWWKSMKFHIGLSVFKMILIVVGFALGIYISGEYNRSKSFVTAHQIMGFIAILPILLMSILPCLVSRVPRPSTIHTAHTWSARFTWAFFVIVGGLGLQLSSSPMHTRIIYALITIAVLLPMAIVYSCIWRKGRIQQEHDEDRDIVLEAYYASQPKPHDGWQQQQVHVSEHNAGFQPPPPYYGGQQPQQDGLPGNFGRFQERI